MWLAFEALVQHSYAFTSIVHGIAPPVVSFDACMKLSVDDIVHDQVNDAREEHVVDVDLCSQLLQNSMATAMVMGSMRLKWVKACAPAVMSPFSRKSNLIVKGARTTLPSRGSPESGDGDKLMEYLRDADKSIDSLKDMALADLKTLFKTCYPDRGGTR